MSKKEKWEELYEEYKANNILTVEELEGKWDTQDKEYKKRLSEISDSTSDEYKQLKGEWKKLKGEFEFEKKSLEKYKGISKNLAKIERAQSNRDVYQSLLDELLEDKEENKIIIGRRTELSKEAEKLEKELQELKEIESHLKYAMKNPICTEKDKEHVSKLLAENIKKQNKNQEAFSKNQLALQKELEISLKPVSEEQIEEAKQGVDKFNKICELLAEGKNMSEVTAILSEINEVRAEPIVPEIPESPAEPVRPAEPEMPESPAEPIVPEIPESPAEPVIPTRPVRPAEPEMPESPAEPVRPVRPARYEILMEGISSIMIQMSIVGSLEVFAKNKLNELIKEKEISYDNIDIDTEIKGLDNNIEHFLRELEEEHLIDENLSEAYVEGIRTEKKLPFKITYDLRDIYKSNLSNKEIRNLFKVAKQTKKTNKDIELKRDNIFKRAIGRTSRYINAGMNKIKGLKSKEETKVLPEATNKPKTRNIVPTYSQEVQNIGNFIKESKNLKVLEARIEYYYKKDAKNLSEDEKKFIETIIVNKQNELEIAELVRNEEMIEHQDGR